MRRRRQPERLLRAGASAFERSLLTAMASERPTTALRARMLRGLGLIFALFPPLFASPHEPRCGPIGRIADKPEAPS